MQLNNSGRLCVIVDTVTLMTSYTWQHIHPGLKGTTCTPRSCLPHEQVHKSQYQWSVVALSVSHRSMVEFSPHICVAYRQQAWLGPFWRQQTYSTPIRVHSPLPRDTFKRFTSVLWFTDSNSLPPLTNFRVQRVRWTVNSGRRQLPVSRLLSSLCPGIVRQDESLPDIAHLSMNSLTLRSMANVLTDSAGCSCLCVWPVESTPVWSRRIDTCGRQLFSVQKCTQLVAGELFTLAKQNMVT